MLLNCNSINEFEKIVKSGITIVQFAATWCAPCQITMPVFESLSNKYKSINFLKVDIDEQDKLVAKLGIHSIPSYLAYSNGQLIDQLIGSKEDKLNAFVNKFI